MPSHVRYSFLEMICREIVHYNPHLKPKMEMFKLVSPPASMSRMPPPSLPRLGAAVGGAMAGSSMGKVVGGIVGAFFHPRLLDEVTFAMYIRFGNCVSMQNLFVRASCFSLTPKFRRFCMRLTKAKLSRSREAALFVYTEQGRPYTHATQTACD